MDTKKKIWILFLHHQTSYISQNWTQPLFISLTLLTFALELYWGFHQVSLSFKLWFVLITSKSQCLLGQHTLYQVHLQSLCQYVPALVTRLDVNCPVLCCLRLRKFQPIVCNPHQYFPCWFTEDGKPPRQSLSAHKVSKKFLGQTSLQVRTSRSTFCILL